MALRVNIDLNYHFIQYIVEMNEIKFEFIYSIEMVADLMTNGLSLDKFEGHVAVMGLRNTSVIATWVSA